MGPSNQMSGASNVGTFYILWLAKGAVLVIVDKDGYPRQASTWLDRMALRRKEQALKDAGWKRVYLTTEKL